MKLNILPKLFRSFFVICLLSSFWLAQNLLNSKPVLAASSLSFTELGSLVDSGDPMLHSFFSANPLSLKDMNNDGYPDLLVTAPNYNSGQGRVYIFPGGKTLNTTPSLIIDGTSTSNVQQNTDGFLGIADLDNDGYQDLVTGNQYAATGTHGSFVFFGPFPNSPISVSSANLTIEGNATDKKNLGYDRTIADFNGDGYLDLALGAGGANSNAGAVYIYYGNGTKSIDTTPDKTITISGSSSLGAYFMSSGDFNGDGFDDLLVEESYSSKGNVYIFYGGADMNTTYDVKFTAEVATDYLTRAVAVADINKDGYDDVCLGAYKNSTVATKSGRAYCFFGSSTLSGDKPVTSANVIISSPTANDNLGRGLSLYDVNNDGNLDLIVGAYQNDGSWNGYVNIYFGNGTTINTTADITITAASIGESAKTFGAQVLGGDMDNDGWPDLFLSSTFGGNGAGYTGRVHVFEVNHGTPVISVSSSNYTNTSTPKVSGTASDVNLNVSNVQWSLGSASTGTWTACTADDGTFDSSSEKFSCSITSALSSGDHTIYLRSVDQNGLYMSSKLYGAASVNYLSSGPNTSWTTSNNEKKDFNLITPDHLYTTEELPTFKFNKADNSGNNINEYQIILTSKDYSDKVYLDGILPDKPTDKNERDTDRMWVYYNGDSISVHAKEADKKLVAGGYRWKVRVVDKAGNSKETETRILLVNSHIANFSNSYFPLAILSPILNLKTNTINIGTKAFSLYGITTTGTKVKLELATSDKATGNKTIIFSRETTANGDSRFGINITKEDNLPSGSYTATLTATNTQGDYQEQIFTLNYLKFGVSPVLGSSVIPAKAGAEGASASEPSGVQNAGSRIGSGMTPVLSSTPSPTINHLPLTVTPTPTKTCFLFFCR